MQVNKKILKILCVAILSLTLVPPAAFADTIALWYGDINKGEVTSRKNSLGGDDVAVEEVVKELGLVRNANQQGVVVSMSGFTVEFWDKASVIRSAHNMVPVPEPITYEGGHWWADAKSTAQAFDLFFTAIGMKPGIKFAQGTASAPAKSKAPKPELKAAPKKEEPQAAATPKPSAESQASEIKPAPQPKEQPATAKPQAVPAVTGFQGGKKPVVVIDAGHGGHDPGAVANGLREKDINLKATMQLGKALEALGVDVRYTRKTDVYLKLAERTEIANKHNASVFVSLHCNAVPKGRKASGLEYYIMAPPSDKDAMQLAVAENRELTSGEDSSAATERSDKRTQLLLKILGDMQQNDKINESTQLCEVLHANAKSSGLPMRRVGQAPFFVLRGAAMPAVLVEMGFLTDAAEAKKLNTESYRGQLCRSIATGVVKYIKDHPVNVE